MRICAECLVFRRASCACWHRYLACASRRDACLHVAVLDTGGWQSAWERSKCA